MNKSVITFFAILAIILAGSTYYFYSRLQAVQQNPQMVAEEEAQDLVTRVGKLMLLPEGETPTVATVTDPELLKAQEFFANSKKDDKVLIYTTALKAVLYRPSEHKIINVAPVTLGPGDALPPAPAPEDTATVEEEVSSEEI